MCDDECVQNIVIIIGLHDKNMNPLHLINTMINIVLSIKMSVIRSGHWRIQNFNLGGPHGERGARAYNGGLGAEPPAGSMGRAPGQGVRGAESILALGRPTDTANLHPWPVAVFKASYSNLGVAH